MRAPLGTGESNNRFSVLARWIKRIPQGPEFSDLYGLGLFLDDQTSPTGKSMLCIYTLAECRDDPARVADESIEAVQQAANENQARTYGSVHWLRGEGPDFSLYLSTRMSLYPQRSETPDVGPSPLDGSALSLITQAQRQAEASARAMFSMANAFGANNQQMVDVALAAANSLREENQRLREQLNERDTLIGELQAALSDEQAEAAELARSLDTAGDALEKATSAMEAQSKEDDGKVISIIANTFKEAVIK